MRRREFLGFLGAAAWSTTALAQTMHRIAILTPSQAQWQPQIFRETLNTLGYRMGANLQIDVHSGDGQLTRMPELGTAAVLSNPDVIVGVNFPGVRAAARATDRIPIVAAAVGDPILLGFVKNIARPEGNVTGISNMANDITTKRIALMKEAVPSARRFALLLHPDEPIVAPQMRDIEASAPSLGIEYRTFPMRTVADLRNELQRASEWGAQGLVRLAGQGSDLVADTIKLADERRLPFMPVQKEHVVAGGLMSYFADPRELWRRVAVYVDRILKGAEPRDLPFEMPTRFELVINLKAAKTLGITVPASLLARADEVIE